ncbi:2-succinyl-5-enolpyruvyl-6-hydroxy-3-cyclohexene-1-carboxylate synthase [Shewanella algicola]|uniref:2-succinyl-5-enolpyruvyl-6-hydroxy-3-cyclohexene-1-carboxylate synthase n=1 Tax=Shewanella algicola TaxID=640633 RepID=A0A9X1Z5G5_9GAMM|nr:2-succinyl-5-enolpyruvyl-6-hydroxy-3-cyclohexene-1-carboxylic-acid synthase [Shewanella algicola]MCL1106566.1 2-succinyl-5-enolpyruvyl-6-hydroxy-3-cyclohexene-1-carboxylic-acid synthase [Shewanella algicola]GGP60132.1 2-succinyl-5-enolpyruvyl-6-hydroxy-3-cyclohexene-1-carboxylate synthase [Shewanella algicola]
MQQQTSADMNLLWGQLILEELARLGVKHVCMAPGSRSTPLTLAAASQTKLTRHIHFDERGLGFMALGLAKADNAPVAIITTSGTAVANLYPAIVEAWLTHVPLIILSGDRPNELIDCGANQAIVQPAIFAGYAKQLNLPTPDNAYPANALLTTIDHAIANQHQPVHINCMYREPLYPSELVTLAHVKKTASVTTTTYLAPLNAWFDNNKPLTRYAALNGSELPTTDTLMRFVHGKGVIVVGTLSPADSPQLIVALAQKLGWPVVVDAQSQLRQHPGVIGHIDQLLLNTKASKLLEQAERVLVFGGRFISKRLIQYLAQQHWHSYWQLLSHSDRLDPTHQHKQVWQTSVQALCQLAWPRSSDANWALQLLPYNESLESLLKQQIDNTSFGEAQVVRAIAASQTDQHTLFIGNSLPIRLYDMYAPIATNTPAIYTNRGASGIDGLIATACGVAADKLTPTTLIIGDLSCLHDLNSMALLKQMTCSFVLVIINNDGGNIFNLLPVPNENLRNDFYRLSHGLEFGYGAAMFGLAYRQVDDIESFQQAYQEAFEFNCASVIEVNVAPNQASDQIAQINQWVKQH